MVKYVRTLRRTWTKEGWIFVVGQQAFGGRGQAGSAVDDHDARWWDASQQRGPRGALLGVAPLPGDYLSRGSADGHYQALVVVGHDVVNTRLGLSVGEG